MVYEIKVTNFTHYKQGRKFDNLKKEFEFTIDPFILHQSDLFKGKVADFIHERAEDIVQIVIVKRSIDGRAKKTGFHIRGWAYIGEAPKVQAPIKPFFNIKNKPTVFIVGAGPSGLFAALRLLQLGIKPIILERGKEIRERRRDLAPLNRSGLVNPESNYCFGEGGAGTYSDGKLYTRSGKKEEIENVLNLFVHFGADHDIRVDARPHIGTNRLPEIISKIKECIVEFGGEVHFEQKVTAIHHSFGKMTGITTNETNRWETDKVILSTGHSARDIFYLLPKSGIEIESKPFALGIRIEHPQSLIDQIQYHSPERHPLLPPAYYQLKEQIEGRGVFSFCMCPGGIIAPCSTEADRVVVNGWSPSKRNNPYSNSGMVVQVELNDIPNLLTDPLCFKSLEFQDSIEKRASFFGGGNQKAPAQRMVDFVEGKFSSSLPGCSYIPGLTSASFQDILPEFIYSKLKKAFPVFGKKMPGYYTNEAVVLGVESRTSSPIKIPRDPITLQNPDCIGLYPCGEGAGYAGGILSAAMDGMKVAESIVKLI